jgi:hypothetical protein
MKKTFQAAVFTLFAASTVQAQEAVQWKVSDGGNGHWYQLTHSPAISWSAAAASASARGGQLATLTSSQENAFVVAELQGNPSRYPWIGLRQAPDAAEPGGGWAWVSSEPLSWTNWSSSEPNGDGAFDADQANIWLVDEPGLGRPLGTWNDWHTGGPDGYMVEWSADCNSDGIVDYGQCRDGSLPDYNGNNIPDCCEQGTACFVGSYPIQWREGDGGNGHWYGISTDFTGWTTGRTQALSVGGDLASLSTNSEWMWARAWLPSILHGYWLGGRQQPNSASPSSGWFWLSGEAIQPEWMVMDDNPCGASAPGVEDMQQDYLHTCCENYPQGRSLGDVEDRGGLGCGFALRSLIEWSADCNSDGIVDKGQILQGQLVDGDQNGVPDVCEVDPCPGDVTNGGTVDATDLSVILAAWGTKGQGEFDADADNSGQVDGADLALVLSGWGPCPQ